MEFSKTAAKIELGGNSVETVNIATLAIVGGLGSFTALGYLVDVWRRRRQTVKTSTEQETPRYWFAALELGSYFLLIPGLFVTLFSYNISVSVSFGPQAVITKALKEDTESVLVFTHHLFENGMIVGGLFMTMFAIVIPTFKVVLLILGATLRRSSDPSRVRWAQKCVALVQIISKWACPDMFAYILMTYLFNSLNKPPHLLAALRLDLGFICFSVFCLGSTVSSLWLRAAPATSVGEEGQQNEVVEGQQAEVAEPQQNMVMRLGNIGTAAVAFAMVFACFTFLGLGVVAPSMQLQLDMDLMYEYDPELKDFSFIIDTLNLEELMHSQVSAWRCMSALVQSIGEGELASVIALIMYAGFAFAFTVFDMIALLAAAFNLCTPTEGARKRVRRAMSVSQTLKKLSMLDVSIMGVVVIVLGMRDLRANGVIVTVQRGLLLLAAAEVLHYATFYLVSRATKHVMQASSKNDAVSDKKQFEENDLDASDATSEPSTADAVATTV